MLKVFWQTVTLFLALVLKRRSQHVLVQNPPAIPSLAVCWLYSRLFRSTFIIDWHNYGYTILALTLGQKHPLVKVSKVFEGYFGKKATDNLCVTKAMKVHLEREWGIK